MTATMRAMVLDRFGGPDVLRLDEIERPRAAPGGVVVKVAYAGVNPADWKAREGWLAQYFTYVFPFVVGFDASGWVAEVGEGVTDLQLGDRVVTASNQGRGERGAYADYVASDQARIVKLPHAVSLRAAATLPTAGMTAWEAARDVGAAGAGSLVLVNGGAGGTGSFAIQIARLAGAQVAATCSAGNTNYVTGLGADLAIDYRRGGVIEAVRGWAPQGVDLVVDTVGQGSLLDGIEAIRPGGTFAAIGTLIKDEPWPDLARAAELGVKVESVVSSFANQRRQLTSLVAALAAGDLRAPEIEVLPLSQAAEAQRRIQDGHVRGKLLLQVGSEDSA